MPGSNGPRPRQRRAGVLIPLFSVRTPTGWGLGEIPDVVAMARWAARAGIRVVQMLPVCAVSGGENSPYAAATAFALDPAYLGLDACPDFAAAGGRAALTDQDRRLLDEVAAAGAVPWARLRPLKERGTRLAFASFHAREWPKRSRRARQLEQFREENRDWLKDYALFTVLHQAFAKHWKEWPKALAAHQPAALAAAAQEHAEEILFVCWQQWQLDEQWRAARQEAAALGVDLMGDLPFMVAEDSADVWKERHLFRLGLRVGTPPDNLCPEGQDWGLPLYDWRAMEKTDFQWMRRRAERNGRLFGLYRVDHVIGMYRTYYRSADRRRSGFSPTDEEAQIRLGETLLSIMGEYGEVIAEDLGMVPEFLRPSLVRLRVPGYRVLRWEKDDLWRDGRMRQFYRDPAKWPEISVATSGTHDTETQAVWYDGLSPEQRGYLARISGLAHLDCQRGFDDGVRDTLLSVLYHSASDLCLLPFQDLLGARERVNVPGSVNEHNWTYRMPVSVDALSADRPTSERLLRLASESRRCGACS
ncbi:MAG: 4-alpha-glucanotransferase [Deltaproteobacteria bacterium]|nr:4-alpha-glucanotransferase [Deltaproteobacteria bacterium]